MSVSHTISGILGFKY